jgi:anti-anti-sigma regulatory factor
MTRHAGTGHEALLVASEDHRRVAVSAWTDAATARQDKLLTLAAPLRSTAGDPLPTLALSPEELPFRTAVNLTRRALDDGFHGLSIIVWVDRLTAATSTTVQANVETTLTHLCRRHPVSALCLYDCGDERSGQLGDVVDRHPDGFHDQYLTVRRAGHTLQLFGEIDIANLDVLTAELKAATRADDRTVHIDLSGTRFLCAAAIAALEQDTAEFRAAGGKIELHNPTSHIARVVGLLWHQPLPGLRLT